MLKDSRRSSLQQKIEELSKLKAKEKEAKSSRSAKKSSKK